MKKRTLRILCDCCGKDCTDDRYKLCINMIDGGAYICRECTSARLEQQRMDKVVLIVSECLTIDALEAEMKRLRPDFMDRWRKDDEKRFKQAVRVFTNRKEELLK